MKIFITDSSETSFFTAVFDAYGENDCLITSDGNLQLPIGSEIINVAGDNEKCSRVMKAIYGYDKYALGEISLVLRSCDPKKEQTVFAYIKALMAAKASIRKRLSMTEVIEFNEIMKKVTSESHNLKGFLRFRECSGGAFYAPYSPDNDITELIMPHFASRFRSERFVIHDVKRGIAGIYNGKNWFICGLDRAEIYLSEHELEFENLWKKYYKSVNIAERPHDKQMRGYMPARYWKFLPEKQNND